MELIKLMFLLTGTICFLSGSIIHFIQMIQMIKMYQEISSLKNAKKLLSENFARINDVIVDNKENKPKANA